MSGNSRYRIGTGATSLMMILVILCITVLSVLSYTGAVSDARLNARAGEVTLAVREAENEAQTRLCIIDQILLEAGMQSEDRDEMLSLLDEKLNQLYADMVRNEDCLSFELPVTESITLKVSLRINDPGSFPRYDIICWSSVSDAYSDTLFEDTGYLEVF